MKLKKIVVIGGGTGTFTILTGLRQYSNLDLSVIVSMMDDGGSNRILRDEFGLLPTSDLRQCMVALASSDSDLTLRKLFTYRYNQGKGIAGMTFGNLFMAALTDIYHGNQEKAIEETCEVLGVRGKIIPVTYDKTDLVATYENSKQILGQHDIDEPDPEIGKYKITKVEVSPKARVNPEALKAISEADLIILGPGDFYTSIIPNLVIEKVAPGLNKSKAKIAYVMNLMTKFGQTVGFKASDFIAEMEKYVGGRSLDYCLINSNYKFPTGVLSVYKKEKAEPVCDDLGEYMGKTKIIRRNLMSGRVYVKAKGDKLIRSLIRHDSVKLAKAVVDLPVS